MKNSRNKNEEEEKNQLFMLYSIYFIEMEFPCVIVYVYATFFAYCSNKSPVKDEIGRSAGKTTQTARNFGNLKEITSNFKRIAWEV